MPACWRRVRRRAQFGVGGGLVREAVDLSGDVPLEAADDLPLLFSFGPAAVLRIVGWQVSVRIRVVAIRHSALVGLAVAALVETMPDGLS